ncbi:hypothetical protein ABENE_13410 [Asticcacaulis benevestitus DSM 16100 = ATCC BAA-896]|uniref:Uncharacterized protein n=1 Tax=Asticcacaulis benevestitus DSM 16100 = ATCC BAA-896 TaxID=1121022 RepID=V4P738_9CAUL|nr:hypothetical protein ABENE_13410 [Asticcacaulis benevestitus DSM 16100 = ATCC BAA-896]
MTGQHFFRISEPLIETSRGKGPTTLGQPLHMQYGANSYRAAQAVRISSMRVAESIKALTDERMTIPVRKCGAVSALDWSGEIL